MATSVQEDTPIIVEVTIKENSKIIKFEAFMITNFLDEHMSRTIVLNHSSGLKPMKVELLDK
jgi:hypothetical protein